MGRRLPRWPEALTGAAFVGLMAGLGWVVERGVSAPLPQGEPPPPSDQDLAEGYREACDRGEAGGCSNLGVMYATGRGVAREEARAALLYGSACDAGHARACSNLGALYADGRGVARDPARAAGLFQRACNAGEAMACQNLIRLRGSDVPKD